MVITLIGYRGSGKSSVARLLADSLGMDRVDTDDLVEQMAGRSIRRIFEDDGEQEFRRLENDAIRQATQKQSVIIAVGGGAVLLEENRRQLKEAGPVIWLQADVATLARRIGMDESSTERRPRLTGQTIQDEVASVLAARLPLYSDAATMTIETDGLSPGEVVKEILQQLKRSEFTR